MSELPPQDHYRPEAPAWMVESAREFGRRGRWAFAKTMPMNPHWWAVQRDAQVDGLGLEYMRLFLLLRDFHYLRKWHGSSYRTIDLAGFSYWYMLNQPPDSELINRKPIESAGWDQQRLYDLPPFVAKLLLDTMFVPRGGDYMDEIAW